MSVRADLIAARKLIETREGWNQLGGWNALLQVAGEEGAFPAYDLLEILTPTLNHHYRYYENDPTTTHADILMLFDRAIREAKP